MFFFFIFNGTILLFNSLSIIYGFLFFWFKQQKNEFLLTTVKEFILFSMFYSNTGLWLSVPSSGQIGPIYTTPPKYFCFTLWRGFLVRLHILLFRCVYMVVFYSLFIVNFNIFFLIFILIFFYVLKLYLKKTKIYSKLTNNFCI